MLSLTIFGSAGIWADNLCPASQWKCWKSNIRSSVFNNKGYPPSDLISVVWFYFDGRKTKVVFYWDQLFQVGWVGWVVSCSIGKKPFSVGLVAQLFQPASNWVETVEKALVAAAVVFAGSKNCYTCHVYPVDPRTGRLHGSLVNNYSPKWRWLVVDIYRAAKRRGKYPSLTTDTEVNSCFSIY